MLACSPACICDGGGVLAFLGPYIAPSWAILAGPIVFVFAPCCTSC